MAVRFNESYKLGQRPLCKGGHGFELIHAWYGRGTSTLEVVVTW